MSLSEDNIAPSTALPVRRIAEADEIVLSFGTHLLLPRRRQLLQGSRRVELGSRAFDVLLILLEAEGKLVTKDELLKRVWPDTVVEEKNLQVQICAIRKALGDGRDLLRTDAGRGYRFTGRVRRSRGERDAATLLRPAKPESAAPATNLSAPISSLVGRERELAELQTLIANHRLVTLTGAGGIGKTQLGLEAARRALPDFADGAWVVELAPLADPELVPAAIARALGIDFASHRNAVDQLKAALDRRHLLLVLDNCEHVIDAVARIAESLLHGAFRLHVLATSQEPLAAEGERTYRVMPLRAPCDDAGGAARAMEHSAVRLLVERAQAADPAFALDDDTAPAVSRICRRLDGIPLAIELAASRVATVGAEEVARRLDDRFRLLTGGRRAALRRHQTLTATLDWSHGLLSGAERAVLRRLAIFAGSFTLDSATVVAAGNGIDLEAASDHVAHLVSKSLVAFDRSGEAPRYRLLDTMRIYALEKLAASGELPATARRHAAYYRDLLERAEASWQTTAESALLARYAPEIDNIRAALRWAFEPEGDLEIGVALAAASAPSWMLLSMLSECRELVGRALTRLGRAAGEQMRHKMLLQAAFAMSSMWAEGPVGATREASERALDLAEHLEDTEYQLRALYVAWIYRLRVGEYRVSLAIAERFHKIAERRADSLARLTGVRLEGTSLFFLGNHARARRALERVLDEKFSEIRRSFVVRFGLDQRVAALVYYARILWLQGFPDQAMSVAHAAIDEARALNHANSLCLALCDSVCSVAAMSGDLQAVERFSAVLVDCAEKHGLGLWQVDSLAFRGWAAVRRGDMAQGLQLLRSTLGGVGGTRAELRHTIFVEALTEALVSTGARDEALAVLQDIVDACRRNDAHWCLPELLRLRGELRLRENSPGAAQTAETDFFQALDLAVGQGARAWQLRAAMSLAGLWRKLGRAAEARAILMPFYDLFTEGFETADLRAARALIDELAAG